MTGVKELTSGVTSSRSRIPIGSPVIAEMLSLELRTIIKNKMTIAEK